MGQAIACCFGKPNSPIEAPTSQEIPSLIAGARVSSSEQRHSRPVRRSPRNIPSFRILVVGKNCSGKSALIKAVFKVDVTATPERSPGKTDIDYEYNSEDNRYLIVHKSSGLGSPAVDSQNFQNIRDFILHRSDTNCSASERLHAVWICIPASDVIDGNLGEGVEDILHMGAVPVILVLTKFDMVVSDILSKVSSDNAELAKVTALQMCEDSCRRHFDKGLREMPAEIVSWEPEFGDLVEKLVVTTDGFIPGPRDPSAGFQVGVQGEWQRISAERLVWSAALRVCRDIVVDASIEVGRSGYWHHLGSKVEFDHQTLKSCVNIIHEDLVEIWNLNDRAKYLSSNEFKARMSHLVKDLARSHCLESDSSHLTRAEVRFPNWVHTVYEGSPKNVRCLMGYILNLMVILDAIFTTTPDDVSPETVLLVLQKHVNSGHKDGIHCDIREFVTAFADKFTVLQKDLILERIIDLIQKFCVPPTGTS
ncbi:hypothetical protein EI94DRAFT_1742200 [Lactarius quietus]|nr:hypothetical protein EI94DRAFT_1742200 [Lactarius quietus]